METVVISIILILLGVGIGVLSGLLGIGGGTIMVPALRLGYGLDAYMATATSLFAIIPISLSGAITHIKARTCIPKLGIVLGLAGAITSSLGVYAGSVSPAWLIMLVAAVIIIYSAYNMLRKAFKKKGGAEDGADPASTAAPESDSRATKDEVADGTRLETAEACNKRGAGAEGFRLSGRRMVLAIVIGLVAGFASGYVGVGGGFIMVPLMTAWLGVPMKKSSGTSLIAIIILAIPGVVQQAMLGHIDYLAGIMMCVGAIPGAVLGAKLVPHVPERTLRFIFSGLLAVAAVVLVVNELVFAG